MDEGEPGETGPPEDRARPLDGWYDAETLESLDQWDPSASESVDPGLAPPSRVVSWSRRTAMGAVMSGLALGLKEVFEPKEQASIVIEVGDDGEPHDLPVELLLDPDDPRGSLALIRRSHFKRPEV